MLATAQPQLDASATPMLLLLLLWPLCAADAIKGLAAAVATDVYDEEKQKQLELKQVCVTLV